MLDIIWNFSLAYTQFLIINITSYIKLFFMNKRHQNKSFKIVFELLKVFIITRSGRIILKTLRRLQKSIWIRKSADDDH